MSFTINQTGIERGAIQLIFESAPIILKRHDEDAADSAYEISLTGTPVVTQFVRAQAQSFLRFRLRLVSGSDVATLSTLMAGDGPVTVKLTPGSTTTISCMFGPRDDQKFEPFSGDYATGQSDGSAVDPIFVQYRVDLLMLRL